MSVFSLLLVISTIVIIIVFIPDILPYCANCKKIKFRAFFRIHKVVGIKLGYSSNKSVCKKCCQKYGVYSFREYEQLEKAKKKVKAYLDTSKYI